MPIINIAEWESFVEQHPQAHILQTAAWGELKAGFGWSVIRISVEPDAGRAIGAQMLFRRLPLGYSLAYIPKGPLAAGDEEGPLDFHGKAWEEMWREVDRICHQEKAIFLKVEPDLLEEQICQIPKGFLSSPHAIQPQRTILVDLSGSEEDILGRMKQKTRYNIRLAQKKGVRVVASEDSDLFYRLMQITGDRDRFGIHSQAYYRRALDLFKYQESCQLLVAEFEGEPLAALMVFARDKRSWYFYGASASRNRELMPTYLLQWEAMRWARGRGCNQYDLWGVPDVPVERLEAQFDQRSDGLWGVYRFKRGFGGVLSRAAGPWDRVYQPALYRLYRLWLMRRGGIDG
jgi:lipid II:glycine glycyltransferase (peptidoglycan interpeptide bridge formation enzyme)